MHSAHEPPPRSDGPGGLRVARDVGWVVVDAEGVVRAWSPGAEALTGLTPEDVVGLLLEHGLRSRPDRPSTLVALLRAVLTSTAEPSAPAAVPCRCQTADGRGFDGVAWVWRTDGGGAEAAFVDPVRLPAATPSRPTPLRAPEAPVERLHGLLGRSAAMREVFRRLRLAAASDVSVLLTGESGTGKELAARAVHACSERSAGPFVALHCAALPGALLESELFGHVRGAFTGASSDRPGLLESADGGTLFLDEVGELEPDLQVKLLRVLQERELTRVGARTVTPIDVRLVTATNRVLEERLAAGALREDFYYRIRVFDVHLPPLRERREDVPLLAEHFADELARARELGPVTFEPVALEALTRHGWPGNVRELRNAVERALVVHEGATIRLRDLPAAVRDRAAPEVGASSPEQELERLRILDALEAHGWNRTRTAESLGVSRVTLWKKIRRYRLDEGVFRRGTREELGRARQRAPGFTPRG